MAKQKFNAPVELPLEDVGVRVPPPVEPAVLHELLRDDVLEGRPLPPRDEELDHAGVEVVHGEALELPPLVAVARGLRRLGGVVRGLLGLERGAVLGERLHRLLRRLFLGAVRALFCLDGRVDRHLLRAAAAGLLAPGGGTVSLAALPHRRLTVVHARELLEDLEVDPRPLLGRFHESQREHGPLELERLDRPEPELVLRDPAPGQDRHGQHLTPGVAQALVRQRQLAALGVAAHAGRAEVLVGRRGYDLGAGRREDGQVGRPVGHSRELVALLRTLGPLGPLRSPSSPRRTRGGHGESAVNIGLSLLRRREVQVLDLPEEVVDLRAPRRVATARPRVPRLLARHEVRQADLVPVEGQEGAEDGLVVRAGVGLVVELEPHPRHDCLGSDGEELGVRELVRGLVRALELATGRGEGSDDVSGRIKFGRVGRTKMAGGCTVAGADSPYGPPIHLSAPVCIFARTLRFNKLTLPWKNDMKWRRWR